MLTAATAKLEEFLDERPKVQVRVLNCDAVHIFCDQILWMVLIRYHNLVPSAD